MSRRDRRGRSGGRAYRARRVLRAPKDAPTARRTPAWAQTRWKSRSSRQVSGDRGLARGAPVAHKGGVPSPVPPQLFDRALIASRVDRAIRAQSGEPADFLLHRAAEELNERLGIVSLEFAVAGDVGTPGPHAAEVLAARRGGGVTLRLAPTRLSAGTGNFLRAIGDVERLPLGGHSFDLIVSLLALHQVNDL